MILLVLNPLRFYVLSVTWSVNGYQGTGLKTSSLNLVLMEIQPNVQIRFFIDSFGHCLTLTMNYIVEFYFILKHMLYFVRIVYILHFNYI